DKNFTLKSLLSQISESEIRTSNETMREMRPRRTVIQNIINYSKSLRIHHTTDCGVVKLNMN
ncbi:MAG TPA: hypothetical protein VJ939_01845, partial [Bacteroidales bacterium]|nr:hypothetical protein [Bacteroidales bacterium]